MSINQKLKPDEGEILTHENLTTLVAVYEEAWTQVEGTGIFPSIGDIRQYDLYVLFEHQKTFDHYQESESRFILNEAKEICDLYLLIEKKLITKGYDMSDCISLGQHNAALLYMNENNSLDEEKSLDELAELYIEQLMSDKTLAENIELIQASVGPVVQKTIETQT